MAHEDIEAIKQVKSAYFRYLDLKQFEELGRLLTEDVHRRLRGREALLRGSGRRRHLPGRGAGRPRIVSHHNGHHPEIELTGPDSATGVWYLHDRVIVPAADIESAAPPSTATSTPGGDGRLAHRPAPATSGCLRSAAGHPHP